MPFPSAGEVMLMSDELRQAARSSMRAAEALAEDARHSPSAAVEWVQALNQAALDTLQWAQAAQTIEALEAAAAMEVAVEEAVQAVKHLLDTQSGSADPAKGSTDNPSSSSAL